MTQTREQLMMLAGAASGVVKVAREDGPFKPLEAARIEDEVRSIRVTLDHLIYTVNRPTKKRRAAV